MVDWNGMDGASCLFFYSTTIVRRSPEHYAVLLVLTLLITVVMTKPREDRNGVLKYHVNRRVTNALFACCSTLTIQSSPSLLIY